MGAAASALAVLLTTCKLDKLISKPPSAAALTVAPGHVRVSVARGSSTPQLDNLIVSNTGSVTLAWQVSLDSGGPWLDVTPKSGRTPAQVQVQLDPGGLDPGEYHGVIVVSAEQAVGSPARVPVDLVVAAGTPPPATHLAFSVPPTNTPVGATITPAVKVSALDASENRVTTFTGAITLALSANSGGGTLSGGGSVDAVNGVATFGSLSIDKAGSGYTLTATSGQLTDATSDRFDITAAPPPPPPPPPPNQPPVAAFSSNCSNLVCGFTSTSSDPDGSISGYAWNFDDGKTATEQNPSHTYSAGGTYSVTLTVTDNQNATGSVSHDVSVSEPPPPPPPPPPNHAPSVSVSGGRILVAVLYQLSASFTDQDGDGPWSYSIDWGNGSESGSTSSQGAINASHTYLAPGSYLIRVTVTDSHGLSGSGEATLTVSL